MGSDFEDVLIYRCMYMHTGILLESTPGSAERVIRTEAGCNHALAKSWDEIMRACS